MFFSIIEALSPVCLRREHQSQSCLTVRGRTALRNQLTCYHTFGGHLLGHEFAKMYTNPHAHAKLAKLYSMHKTMGMHSFYIKQCVHMVDR